MPTPDDVRAVVGDLPHMSLERGETMSRFIREHGIRNILELGFARGVSTCYMAAAVQPASGHVVTIDVASKLLNDPSAESLLLRLGLRDYVTLFYESSSYNWRIARFLSETPRPSFDLIYFDGHHTWESTGFAFLIAEKVLAPGGWNIFDDLDWTFASSPSWGAKSLREGMAEDERTTPQIRLVYEILVRDHPHIAEHFEKDGWAYAQKTLDAPAPARALNDLALVAVKQQATDVRRASSEKLGLTPAHTTH